MKRSMPRISVDRVRPLVPACGLAAFVLVPLTAACQESGDGGPRAPQPEATTTSSASSNTVAAKRTCPTRAKRYWIEIHGDGPVQRLEAGAPPGPKPERNCEPALTTSPVGDVVSACADPAELRKSCFWANAAGGAYFDRQGNYWQLKPESFPSQVGELLDAELVLTGKSRQRSESLRLKVVLHVGRDVVQVEAPEWANSENSLPL